MKKAILTAAALIAISTSAMADVTNPVHKAETQEWFEISIPMIKVANACKAPSRFKYMEEVMRIGNLKARATDDMEKQIVNLWYMTAETTAPIDKTFKKIIHYAKTNRDHPEIVKVCDQMEARIQELSKK